jgi:hypothetical protein
VNAACSLVQVTAPDVRFGFALDAADYQKLSEGTSSGDSIENASDPNIAQDGLLCFVRNQ